MPGNINFGFLKIREVNQMKYTPMQLLEFVNEDDEIKAGAVNVLVNNDKGFGFFELGLDNIGFDENGIYVELPDIDGEGAGEIPVEGDPSKMKALLKEMRGRQVRLALVSCCGKSELITVGGERGDSAEDVEEGFYDQLLLLFFSMADIDTKGRLKAAIEKGWEMAAEEGMFDDPDMVALEQALLPAGSAWNEDDSWNVAP
jgi:hypothetical protein